MTHLRLRHLALLVALAASAACASSSHSGAKKAGVTPPQQLRAGPYPEIREVVDLRYEVMIDAEGQPDISTLKITGKGASAARGPIEDWIRSSVFKPATQNGQPVAGLYKGGIKSRVEVRRM